MSPVRLRVVLKGGEGIGKGFLLQRLGELVGREHYAHISNSKKRIRLTSTPRWPIFCCYFATRCLLTAIRTKTAR